MLNEAGCGYLTGFSPEDCIPATGDGTDLKLRWKGGERIGEHPKIKRTSQFFDHVRVDLRLVMRNSTLYSVKIKTLT